MGVRPAHELNQGFGDGLSQAFEMIATPGIFGLLGFLVDRRLDTTPVFTLLFAAVVLAYMVSKFVRAYTSDMAKLEASAPWSQPLQVGTKVHADG